MLHGDSGSEDDRLGAINRVVIVVSLLKMGSSSRGFVLHTRTRSSWIHSDKGVEILHLVLRSEGPDWTLNLLYRLFLVEGPTTDVDEEYLGGKEGFLKSSLGLCHTICCGPHPPISLDNKVLFHTIYLL